MPRGKSRKKGSGRKKAAEEDLVYGNKSTPEKRAYHNKAREQRVTTKSNTQQQPTDLHQESSSLVSLPPGRPPIGDVPLTSRTHQKRSTERCSLKRKAVRVSKIRSEAARSRWDLGEGTSADAGESSDDNDESALGVPMSDDEEDAGELSDDNLPLSRTTLFRRKA